jgi:hypothetical protein
MTRTGPVAPRLAALLVLVAGAAIAFVHLVDGPSAASSPEVLLRGARGAVAIDQSRAGRAILKSDNLRPGEVVRGGTTVRNTGRSRARIMLDSTNLVTSTGPGGVAFSSVLQLRVRKRTPRNPRVGPKTVYEGALGGMKPLRVGVWHPGGHHRFTFRVHYPDGENVTGASNSWQGSSVSIGFVWTASALR